MLVGLSPVFVEDAKKLFVYDFVAHLMSTSIDILIKTDSIPSLILMSLALLSS